MWNNVEKVTYWLFKIFEIQKGHTFSFNDFEFVYNGSQYCDTNSRLNKEKLTVGGSLKSSIVNSAILQFCIKRFRKRRRA